MLFCFYDFALCWNVIPHVYDTFLVHFRAMDFLVELFRNLLEHQDWAMSEACTDSYGKTLKKWHGWIASSTFSVMSPMSLQLFDALPVFILFLVLWCFYAGLKIVLRWLCSASSVLSLSVLLPKFFILFWALQTRTFSSSNLNLLVTIMIDCH